MQRKYREETKEVWQNVKNRRKELRKKMAEGEEDLEGELKTPHLPKVFKI